MVPMSRVMVMVGLKGDEVQQLCWRNQMDCLLRLQMEALSSTPGSNDTSKRRSMRRIVPKQ
jgi:hypothetical protein